MPFPQRYLKTGAEEYEVQDKNCYGVQQREGTTHTTPGTLFRPRSDRKPTSLYGQVRSTLPKGVIPIVPSVDSVQCLAETYFCLRP